MVVYLCNLFLFGPFFLVQSDFVLFCLYIACLVLISYLGGQERLYCSDERLDVAYDNPSLFCQISGMAR